MKGGGCRAVEMAGAVIKDGVDEMEVTDWKPIAGQKGRVFSFISRVFPVYF